MFTHILRLVTWMLKPCDSEAQIALKAEDVESQVTAVVAPPVAIKSQEPIEPTHPSQLKC